ncbi:hypothetical protein EKO27_g9225 [Xylaria grammica]|uniref:Ketoreductase (KR) domain-containing protein n=1 Tax=Xylaria grammica TaxID=363999 RepID=A0A439CUN6_9PEZI|nr:hypothetical protein EKO27_g9225 [Xylaria grammica]
MPTYLVTGASRGLGYAFVKTLASDPLNTVIGLARNKKATEERLHTDGIQNVHVLSADITDKAALNLAAEEARRILGSKGLDVLINNAAYAFGPTGLKSLQDLGTQEVVAISTAMSDLGFTNETGLYNGAAYSASKAALNMFFAKLSAAYKDQGILFMSLCPGVVNTQETEPKLSDDELKVFQVVNEKFTAYAPNFCPLQPVESAQRCLAAIDQSSLAKGHGGSFRSQNGTGRWL